MNPAKIPAELTDRKRWVVFKVGPSTSPTTGKKEKLPLVAGTTDSLASVSEAATWASFEAVMQHVEAAKAQAASSDESYWPAYVLKKEDRIVFLDLDAGTPDETVESVLEIFPTAYAERSSSEKGAHLIMKGTLSSHGCRSGLVEIYSHNRFCIFTGDVIDNRLTIGTADPKDLADLELQLTSGKAQLSGDLPDAPQKIDDDEVLVLAERHSKDGKFRSLYYEGDWQQWKYPSQSEADHALIGMIADATRNNEQTRRLWGNSKLYRSTKDHKFRYSIRRVRSQQAKEDEDEKWAAEFVRPKTKPTVSKADVIMQDSVFTSIPPGLLKEIYQAYMNRMYYPVRETALAAALITVTALFQRKYRTKSNKALNLWLFLLGDSGVGKNFINEGPDTFFHAAKANMDSVLCGELRSDAAIEDALRLSPRMCLYHHECSGWLRSMCEEKAPAAKQQMRDKLTDSYTCARGVMKARLKRTEKGVSREGGIERPCLTIYGETVTSSFYDAIGTSNVAGGFVPRFTVMEIDKKKAAEDPGPQLPFPPDLLQRCARLAEDATLFDVVQQDALEVPVEQNAWNGFLKLQKDYRKKMLASENDAEPMKQTLLSRTAEKITKIATLLAVCEDQNAPVVSQAHMDWAVLFVTETDNRMIHHLCSGEFDGAAHQQLSVMRSIFVRAFNMPAARRAKNGFNTVAVQQAPEIVPYGWLLSQAKALATFRDAAQGTSTAVNRCLKDLQDCGEIMEILNPQEITKYGVRGRLFRNICVGLTSED